MLAFQGLAQLLHRRADFPVGMAGPVDDDAGGVVGGHQFAEALGVVEAHHRGFGLGFLHPGGGQGALVVATAPGGVAAQVVAVGAQPFTHGSVPRQVAVVEVFAHRRLADPDQARKRAGRRAIIK